ncbi:jg19256 [Pararge aegeria aegeria]|uniref:Jg19256 protein n=1 Tax=Pararge aegeria aegeria TaxID=348720 RepID=A0A8S4S2E9_9NEOP|nr:jg19256 [Pararge aegeria aegeria]
MYRSLVFDAHLSRERQPRAARCRLLVIVMRVRTVALLSGEQKMAAYWSRATDGPGARGEGESASHGGRERVRQIALIVSSSCYRLSGGRVQVDD